MEIEIEGAFHAVSTPMSVYRIYLQLSLPSFAFNKLEFAFNKLES